MPMADVQDSFPGLFLSEEGADVHFRVPSDVNKKHYKRFPAHSRVLSQASNVFGSMFSVCWAERIGGNEDIELDDVLPEAFQALLAYAYTKTVYFDEPPVEGDIQVIMSLHNAARKCMLVALEERCLKHMLDRMLPQDAAAVLEYALGTLPELRQRALELVARFTVEAVNSRGFLEAVPAVVEAILQLDRVSSTTELVLFQALIRWAEAKSVRQGMDHCSLSRPENLRRVSGHLFDLIRFPAMPLEEFVGSVAPMKLFTAAEEHHLVAQIRDGLFPTSLTAQFNHRPRKTIHSFLVHFRQDNFAHWLETATTTSSRQDNGGTEESVLHSEEPHQPWRLSLGVFHDHRGENGNGQDLRFFLECGLAGPLALTSSLQSHQQQSAPWRTAQVRLQIPTRRADGTDIMRAFPGGRGPTPAYRLLGPVEKLLGGYLTGADGNTLEIVAEIAIDKCQAI